MEPTQLNWLARFRRWPRRLLSWAGGQVKKRDQQLKDRYGARYTKAMVVTAFIALFLPLPGSTPMAVVVVAVVAEIHRAISKKRRSAPILKEKEATFDRNWAQPGGMAGAG